MPHPQPPPFTPRPPPTPSPTLLTLSHPKCFTLPRAQELRSLHQTVTANCHTGQDAGVTVLVSWWARLVPAPNIASIFSPGPSDTASTSLTEVNLFTWRMAAAKGQWVHRPWDLLGVKSAAVFWIESHVHRQLKMHHAQKLNVLWMSRKQQVCLVV